MWRRKSEWRRRRRERKKVETKSREKKVVGVNVEEEVAAMHKGGGEQGDVGC